MVPFSRTPIYNVYSALNSIKVQGKTQNGNIRIQYVSSSFTSTSSGIRYGAFFRRILEKVRSVLSIPHNTKVIDIPLLSPIRGTSSILVEPFKEKPENYTISVFNVKSTLYNRVYVLKKTVAKPKNVTRASVIEFKSTIDGETPAFNKSYPLLGTNFGHGFFKFGSNHAPEISLQDSSNSWSDSLFKQKVDKKNHSERLNTENYNSNEALATTNLDIESVSTKTFISKDNIKTTSSNSTPVNVNAGSEPKNSFYLEDQKMNSKIASVNQYSSLFPKTTNLNSLNNDSLMKHSRKGFHIENSHFGKMMVLNPDNPKLRRIFYFENKSAHVIEPSKLDNWKPVHEYLSSLNKKNKKIKPARINFVEFHRIPHKQKHSKSSKVEQDVTFHSPEGFFYRKETSISFENTNNKFWIPLSDENLPVQNKTSGLEDSKNCSKEASLTENYMDLQRNIRDKSTLKDTLECKDVSDEYISKIPLEKDKLIEGTTVPNKSILNIINSIDKSAVIIQKDLYITDHIIQKIKDERKEKDEKNKAKTCGLLEDKNGEYILYFEVKSNESDASVNVSICDLTNRLSKSDFNQILKTNENKISKRKIHEAMTKYGDNNEVMLLENSDNGEIILLKPQTDDRKNIISFSSIGNITFKGISTIDIIRKSVALLEKEKYHLKKSNEQKEGISKEDKDTMEAQKLDKSTKNLDSFRQNINENIPSNERYVKCISNPTDAQSIYLFNVKPKFQDNKQLNEFKERPINDGYVKLKTGSSNSTYNVGYGLPISDTNSKNHQEKRKFQLDELSVIKKRENVHIAYEENTIQEGIRKIERDKTCSKTLVDNVMKTNEKNDCITHKQENYLVPLAQDTDTSNNVIEKEQFDSTVVKPKQKNQYYKLNERVGKDLTIDEPALHQNDIANKDKYCQSKNVNKRDEKIDTYCRKLRKANIVDKITNKIPTVECPSLIDDSVQHLLSKNGKGDNFSESNKFKTFYREVGGFPVKNNSNTGVQHISQTSITTVTKNGKIDVKVSEKETVIDSRLPIPFSTESLFQIFGSTTRLKDLINVIDSAKNELVASNLKNNKTTAKDIIGKLDEIIRLIKIVQSSSVKNINDQYSKKIPASKAGLKESTKSGNDPQIKAVSPRDRGNKITTKTIKLRRRSSRNKIGLTADRNKIKKSKGPKYFSETKEDNVTGSKNKKNVATIPQKVMSPHHDVKSSSKFLESKSNSTTSNSPAHNEKKEENVSTEQNINNYVHLLKSVYRKNKSLKSKRRHPGFFDHKSLSKRDKKILKEILKGAYKTRKSTARRTKEYSSILKSNANLILQHVTKDELNIKSSKPIPELTEQNTINLKANHNKEKGSIHKSTKLNELSQLVEKSAENNIKKESLKLISGKQIKNEVPKNNISKDLKSQNSLTTRTTEKKPFNSDLPSVINVKTPAIPKNNIEKQYSHENKFPNTKQKEIKINEVTKQVSHQKTENDYVGVSTKEIKSPKNSPSRLIKSSPKKTKTPKKSTPTKNIPVSPKYKFSSLKDKDSQPAIEIKHKSTKDDVVSQKLHKSSIHSKLGEKSDPLKKNKTIKNYEGPFENKKVNNPKDSMMSEFSVNAKSKELDNKTSAQNMNNKNHKNDNTTELTNVKDIKIKSIGHIENTKVKTDSTIESVVPKLNNKQHIDVQSDSSQVNVKPISTIENTEKNQKSKGQPSITINSSEEKANSKAMDGNNDQKAQDIIPTNVHINSSKAKTKSVTPSKQTDQESPHKTFVDVNVNYNEAKFKAAQKSEIKEPKQISTSRTNTADNESQSIYYKPQETKPVIILKSNDEKEESNTPKQTENLENNKFKAESQKKSRDSKTIQASLSNFNKNASISSKEALEMPVEKKENSSPTFQIYVATKTSVESKNKVKKSSPINLSKGKNKEKETKDLTSTQSFTSRINEHQHNVMGQTLGETNKSTITVIERKPKNVNSKEYKEKFKQTLIQRAKKKIEQQRPIQYRVKSINIMPAEDEMKIKSNSLKDFSKGKPKGSSHPNKFTPLKENSMNSVKSNSSFNNKTDMLKETKTHGKNSKLNTPKTKQINKNKPTPRRNTKAIKLYTERSTVSPEESKETKNANTDSSIQNVKTNKQLKTIESPSGLKVTKTAEVMKKLENNEHILNTEKTKLKAKSEVLNNRTNETLSKEDKFINKPQITRQEGTQENIIIQKKDDLSNTNMSSNTAESLSDAIPTSQTKDILKSPIKDEPLVRQEREKAPFPMFLIDLDKMTKEIKPDFDIANSYACAIPLKQVENYPLMNSKKSESFVNPDSVLNICPSKDPMLRKELSLFPSVTKILNLTLPTNYRKILREWRKNMIKDVGENGFKSYYKGQMTRGTQFHNLIQDYLVWGRGREKPTTQCFQSVQHILSDLSELAVINSHVVHKNLAYRGVVDCIAKYKNRPVAIEWKRLDNKQNLGPTSLETSFLQLSAYVGALNFDENYKFQIKGGIIVLAYSDGNKADVHEVTIQECEKFWKLWLGRLQSYHTYIQSKKK